MQKARFEMKMKSIPECSVARKEAAPSAANTEGGKAELAPVQDANPGPIVSEEEGGYQE